MELNQKVIGALASSLGIDVEVLTKAVSSADGSAEETEFKTPEGKFYTETQLETIKDNHGKRRYDAGKLAGEEILLKDLSDTNGIDVTKDKETFINSFKAKILEEAKVEPNEKIKELTESMENLRTKLTEKDGELNQIKQEKEKTQSRYEMVSTIPDLPESLGLTKDEVVDLFERAYESKEDGIYKNGQLLKDDLENPIDRSTAVNQFLEERGWLVEDPKGRGGGAQQGGKKTSTSTFSSMEEYESHIKEKGLHVGSEEAKAILSKALEANPELE